MRFAEDRIRVMFVVPRLVVGGAERHITTLLPRLDPERFIPSLVCIGEEGDLFSELTSAGIDAVAFDLPGKQNFGTAFLKLVARMKNFRPDVVVVWGYSAEILGRLAARAAGVPTTIVWVHNSADVVPRSDMRKFAEKFLVRWTDSYFGVAEAQRGFMVDSLRYPNEKIRIIHNGVDPSLFSAQGNRTSLRELGLKPDDPVVAIIAALRVEKDHITFLRAAQRVLESVPTAQFLIVGDGDLRGNLEALAAELGISGSVSFVGWRTDVDRILPAVDVVVLCSVTECFPISILEAMAAERPVVCTDVGGISEMVQDGVSGFLVPPGNHSRLAERLLDVLSDVDGARRMGRAGRLRVERDFTLDRSVRNAELEIAAAVESARRNNRARFHRQRTR